MDMVVYVLFLAAQIRFKGNWTTSRTISEDITLQGQLEGRVDDNSF